MTNSSNISSVLAGNSRLAFNGTQITVEPQMSAFREGIKRAVAIAEATGVLPQISIAFDHRGTFRKYFLSAGLTNSQKRHPRLSQLHPTIVTVFAPVAKQAGVTLDDIQVIHEDSAKSHIEHLVTSQQIPGNMLRHVVSDNPTPKSEEEFCTLEGGCGSRITCAAITAEYFRKAAGLSKSGADKSDFPICNLLEVFFEQDPWSTNTIYVRGLQLAHCLGINLGIQLNLVLRDDKVAIGKPMYPHKAT